MLHKVMGLSNRMAVISAGYSASGAKQRGTRLMQHPLIRAALAAKGFDLTFAGCIGAVVFRPGAGCWFAVSPTMPKSVYYNAIEFLSDAMNCKGVPLAMRLSFAKALLPYQHRKIGRLSS